MHVSGTLHVRDDVDYVRWVAERLTAKHEAAFEHPGSIEDAPSRYVEGQLRAVVGIELRITRVEAKVKASQNRPPADVVGVVRGLRGRGELAIVEEVEEVEEVERRGGRSGSPGSA